jgi:hypothetical protein
MSAITITIFVLGYAAIALEHTIKLNKAVSGLINNPCKLRRKRDIQDCMFP